MADQATFGDFILGLEGLAILRAWISDPATVRARTQKIVNISKEFEDAPWSTPIVASERTVTAGYAEWAATYDISRNPMFLAEEPIVHELLARYPVGTALDAACGTGRHAAYLAPLGHQVTGIDSTPEMLEMAKAKVPAAQFETGDLTAIPLSDGAMDTAVCSLALTHCADLGPPIRELARVVRPGGHVVISDVHPLMVLLGVHGGYRRQPERSKGSSGTTSTWHRTILPCFKTRDSTSSNALSLSGEDPEIATIGFAEQMPDLMEAAVRGLPIVIVWELKKGA